jgi:DNA repair protein RadA/Sms
VEGTRPILVEIQALVAFTRSTFPQRRATGLDLNRVVLLVAVIEKHLGAQLSTEDIYVNVAGGLALRETALDLGIVAALVSSFKEKPIDSQTVVVGEVGLLGEVRRVRKLRERLSEAARLGYTRAVIPAGGESRAARDRTLPRGDARSSYGSVRDLTCPRASARRAS